MTDEEKTEDVSSEEENVEVEVPCDPATMNCDEMRDKIITLSSERARFENTIKHLDEVKQTMSSPDLDKIYDDAVKHKKEIDDEIYGTFERFTVCTTKTPTPPKDEETV